MHPIRLGVLFLVFLLFLGGVALMIPAVEPGEHVWSLSMFAVGLVLFIGVLVSSSAATARARRGRPEENRAARRRVQATRR